VEELVCAEASVTAFKRTQNPRLKFIDAILAATRTPPVIYQNGGCVRFLKED
jgi:hypothetical protein